MNGKSCNEIKFFRSVCAEVRGRLRERFSVITYLDSDIIYDILFQFNVVAYEFLDSVTRWFSLRRRHTLKEI
jgi:hypothetical protein